MKKYSLVPGVIGASQLARLAAGGFLILSACSHDAVDDAAWQASRYGTAAGEGHGGRDTAGLQAATQITEKFYYVAKYEATLEQRRVAEAVGRKAAPARAHIAHHGVKPPRYLAVQTQPDARAKTKTNVMIFDTESQEIVGNNVYDLNGKPPAGTVVKFETYAAEFVGSGGG